MPFCSTAFRPLRSPLPPGFESMIKRHQQRALSTHLKAPLTEQSTRWQYERSCGQVRWVPGTVLSGVRVFIYVTLELMLMLFPLCGCGHVPTERVINLWKVTQIHLRSFILSSWPRQLQGSGLQAEAGWAGWTAALSSASLGQAPPYKSTWISLLLLQVCSYPFPIWGLPVPALCLQQGAASLPTGLVPGERRGRTMLPMEGAGLVPGLRSTHLSHVSLPLLMFPGTGQNLPQLEPHATAKWTNDDALSLLPAFTGYCSSSGLGTTLTTLSLVTNASENFSDSLRGPESSFSPAFLVHTPFSTAVLATGICVPLPGMGASWNQQAMPFMSASFSQASRMSAI